jgi:membrane associated rhomboid family serine protease
VVNVILIAANIAAFLYEMSLREGLNQFIGTHAFIPAAYFQTGNWFADGRAILISMFLHGGLGHLAGNMLYLWIFGDNVEDRLGHVGYALFYLFCGWLATLAHAFTNAGSEVPSIGASGAISGVLGAYLVMFPRARVLTLIPFFYFFRVAELPALLVLGLWFVMQLFSGTYSLGVADTQSAGVAWWAHIGGFVAGMVLGGLFGKRRRRRPSWEA